MPSEREKHQQYSAIYPGSIYDANDPESRGRIRILVPHVLGTAVSAWAEPMIPPAPLWKPEVGGRVWVWFNGGDHNKPVFTSAMEVVAENILAGQITTEKLAVGAVTAEKITTGAVIADKLESAMVLASQIILGTPLAERLQLDPTSIRGFDGNNQTTMSLAVGTKDDFWQFKNAAGEVVAAINSKGDMVVNSIDATGNVRFGANQVSIDGDTLDNVIKSPSRGVVAHGLRTPNITKIVGEYGVMGLTWVTPADTTERMYSLEFTASIKSQYAAGTVGSEAALRFRVTTDGSTPTINSPLLYPKKEYRIAGGSPHEIQFYNAGRSTLNNTTFKILVTIEDSLLGAGYNTVPDSVTALTITDLGKVQEANQAYKNTGGGTLGPLGTDTGLDPAPVPSTRVRIYQATWGANYDRGSGALVDNAGQVLFQDASRSSVIGFNSADIQRDLAGATVDKVEMFLFAKQWYKTSGGTFAVGYHGSSSAPSTWGGLTSPLFSVVDVAGIQKPGGKWAEIVDGPGQGGWKTGVRKGLTFSMPFAILDAFEYTGKFKGPNAADGNNLPRLRITFTK